MRLIIEERLSRIPILTRLAPPWSSADGEEGQKSDAEDTEFHAARLAVAAPAPRRSKRLSFPFGRRGPVGRFRIVSEIMRMLTTSVMAGNKNFPDSAHHPNPPDKWC